MSLLDDVMRAAQATSPTPSAHPELDMVQQLLSHHGGVQGLADAFTRGGLGAQVQSWIGTGANLPVSGAQLASLLGSGQLGTLLQNMAGGPGVGRDEMLSRLARVLPMAIDHLTPNGQVPQHGAGGFDLGALAASVFGPR